MFAIELTQPVVSCFNFAILKTKPLATIKRPNQIEISVSTELKLFIKSIAASFQFIFNQNKYALQQRVDVLEIIERSEVVAFASKIEQTQVQDKISLSRTEVYLFYSLMEVVCRSFLTDFADDFKAMALKHNKITEEHYLEVRNTELKIAQALIQQIKKDFAGEEDFEELLEKIELLDE